METHHAEEAEMSGHRDRGALLGRGAGEDLCAAVEGTRNDEQLKRLYDLGELRLKEMDEAGIDMQVLSHGAPSAQKLTGDDAVALVAARQRPARRRGRQRTRPLRRLRGAADQRSGAAADELERTVTKLGFKGAMIHGLANGMFLDDKRFWPIFERAEKLDVPIYLHPSMPQPAVMDAYYKDYTKDFPMVIRAAWGFTVETATQAIRMVLSGVFDKYPRPQDHPRPSRRDAAVPGVAHRPGAGAPGQQQADELPRRVLQAISIITTSGNFSNPALLCCVHGDGRRPHHVRGRLAVRAQSAGHRMDGDVPLCDEDKGKILSGNAKRLLRM